MFNGKSKSEGFELGAEKPASGSASLIGAGTTMKGDITSNGDLRIDGTLVGNIHSSAKDLRMRGDTKSPYPVYQPQKS